MNPLHDTALTALDRAGEFIATHPDLPTPGVTVHGFDGSLAYDWHLDEDHAAAAVVINSLPGDWTEHSSGGMTWFSRDQDGDGLTVFVNAYLVPLESQKASLAKVIELGANRG